MSIGSQRVHPRKLFLLSWNPRAFLAGFGEADGDRLLAAFDRASLAALSRLQRAAFLAPHCAGNSFGSALAVAASAGFFLGWHLFPPSA